MEEYSYVIKIPKQRVGVLIGPNGEVKNHLQDLTGVNIDIDSKEGEVTLKSEDSLKMFQLQDVVKAIARGFNPDVAQLLLKQDFILEIINITEFVKDKKNHLQRARGRVIGTGGKARETLEKLTETYISVYGKTVSIIGTVERANIARNGVERLLAGAPHGPVYKGLEESMAALKKREVLS